MEYGPSNPAHLRPETIRRFILAGNAVFTIRNEVSGNRFTYRIQKAEDMIESYFIKLFVGRNNEDWYSYKYMGMIRGDQFISTKGSKIPPTDKGFMAFKWFWQNLQQLPAALGVYHEGRCGRCGKTLTVPESIKCGFGPECIKLMLGGSV